MNVNKKSVLIHKIYALASAGINISIPIIWKMILDITVWHVIVLISLLAIVILQIVLSVSLDMDLKHTTKIDLISDYIKAFILSCLSVCYSYIKGLNRTAIAIMILMILEACFVPIITYRYRIINKFKSQNKQKQKSNAR